MKTSMYQSGFPETMTLIFSAALGTVDILEVGNKLIINSQETGAKDQVYVHDDRRAVA